MVKGEGVRRARREPSRCGCKGRKKERQRKVAAMFRDAGVRSIPTPGSLFRLLAGAPIKKEKIRMRLLRFMKKILRDCRSAKTLQSFLGKMRRKSSRNLTENGYLLKRYSKENEIFYIKLYSVYSRLRGSRVLDVYSCTESSPTTTDARNKQKRQLDVVRPRQKSWNDKYVSELFDSQELREFYMYYVDFLNEGEDKWARKLAAALGIEPWEGLFEEVKFLYRRDDVHEPRDTVEEGFESEVLEGFSNL